MQLGYDVVARCLRESRQAGTRRHFEGMLGEVPAQDSKVVPFAAHGIAEDYCSTIWIKRPRRISEVFHSFARAGDRPFLRTIHRVGDERRNRQTPLNRIPGVVPYPTA